MQGSTPHYTRRGRTDVPPPYTAREAAQLLGLSEDTVRRHPDALGGHKIGSQTIIPRFRVDQLVYGPDGPLPAIDRVLALLPQLGADELRRVALRALELQGEKLSVSA